MKTMKTKSIRIFAFALVLLISIAGISAFGIGCAYSNENPLKLFPGESSEVLINLQNDKVIQLKASIIEGADIVSFLDASDVYNVPAGWVNAKLRVSVPASASIGQEYVVTMNFAEISSGQTGTVGLSSAIEKSFKVLVVEKPAVQVETPAPTEEGISSIWWILGVVVLVIIIAIIWFVVKNKKE